MVTSQYYKFTPCCESAHPCYFKVPVTNLPNLPLVYNYTGPTVMDAAGYPLETGKCYRVEQLISGDIGWVLSLTFCPEPDPITLLPYTTVGEVCPEKNSVVCPCEILPNQTYSVYSLQPCCGGEPTTVYLVNDTLVDGTTYIYNSDNPDGNLVAPSCYTASSITYTGAGVPPFTQVIISEFTEVPEGCGDNEIPYSSICEIFCLPCICTRFLWTGAVVPGDTYSISYIDCNNEFKSIDIPTDGITWTEKVCIKYIVSVCPSPNVCWKKETYGNCTVDLTNPNDPIYECPSCFELRDCTGIEDSIYTLNDQVSQYINTQQVIQIVGSETCWRVYNTTESCDCAIAVTVESVYDSCSSCINPKGFKLTECTTGEVQYTTTDLSNYTTAILQTNCPGCWKVEPIDIVPPSSLPVTVNASFDDCKTCNATFYELVDCTGFKDNIITIEDLSDYVGKVIKIKYCPETCWEVNVTTPQEISGVVYLDEVYVDCPECLLTMTAQCVSFTNSLAGNTSFSYTDIYGQVQKINIAGKYTTPKICVLGWDINNNITVNVYGDCIDGQCPTPPQPKRKVTPGYNTAVCSTEYYENVECNFADWMYKDVLENRYGIANCCPEELMKWEIKHEMLMLDVLVNPDYTCATTNTCNCPSICNCGYISLDIIYTNCPPPLVTCTTYFITILSPTGGILVYKNCAGEDIREEVPSLNTELVYTRCGVSGQTDADIYFIGTTLVFTIEDSGTPC